MIVYAVQYRRAVHRPWQDMTAQFRDDKQMAVEAAERVTQITGVQARVIERVIEERVVWP